MLSSKMRASSNADVRTIRHHLKQLESASRGPYMNVVVGVQDYDPSKGVKGGEGGVAQWKELEMQAAVGVQGALHENFVQSVQVMDDDSRNSQMNFTAVKGTC